eukprot:COSAG03_NODE_831_length_5685_cov_144.824740_4_plen_83_part_00
MHDPQLFGQSFSLVSLSLDMLGVQVYRDIEHEMQAGGIMGMVHAATGIYNVPAPYNIYAIFVTCEFVCKYLRIYRIYIIRSR